MLHPLCMLCYEYTPSTVPPRSSRATPPWHAAPSTPTTRPPAPVSTPPTPPLHQATSLLPSGRHFRSSRFSYSERAAPSQPTHLRRAAVKAKAARRFSTAGAAVRWGAVGAGAPPDPAAVATPGFMLQDSPTRGSWAEAASAASRSAGSSGAGFSEKPSSAAGPTVSPSWAEPLGESVELSLEA